jgi:hypothetical protein
LPLTVASASDILRSSFPRPVAKFRLEIFSHPVHTMNLPKHLSNLLQIIPLLSYYPSWLQWLVVVVLCPFGKPA